MKKLIILISILTIISNVSGDTLAREFVENIIRQNIEILEPELELSEWEQSVSGGYILRFAFDIDGDSKDEQFIASSLNSDKLLCEWNLYEKSTNKLLGKEILLRPYGFWWNADTKEILEYVSYGADGGSAILSKFDNAILKTRSEQVSPEELGIGLEKDIPPRKGFVAIKPIIEICLLADIVSNQTVVWSPLTLDDSGNNYSLPNGRLLLKKDAHKVELLKKFTPAVAMQKLTNPDIQLQNSKDETTINSNPPIIKTPDQNKFTDAAPTRSPSNNKWTNSTIYVILGALIFTVISLVVIIFRKGA